MTLLGAASRGGGGGGGRERHRVADLGRDPVGVHPQRGRVVGVPEPLRHLAEVVPGVERQRRDAVPQVLQPDAFSAAASPRAGVDTGNPAATTACVWQIQRVEPYPPRSVVTGRRPAAVRQARGRTALVTSRTTRQILDKCWRCGAPFSTPADTADEGDAKDLLG